MDQVEPTTQERILKALSDQKATISKLRDMLKTTEQERDAAGDELNHVYSAREDVIEAHERELKGVKDAASYSERNLRSENLVMSKRADGLYKRCLSLSKESSKIELKLGNARAAEAKAKAEAKEAKEQVEKIWEVLQGDEGAGQGKRKADDVADGHTRKKVRMGSEAQ